MTRTRLRVLGSPRSAAVGANPYSRLLYDAVAELEVEVEDFARWKLLRRYDVVHVHWPEFLIRWDRARETWPDLAKVLGLLWLARRRGTVLVWTGHDLEPHSELPQRPLRIFMACFIRMTDLLISLGAPASEQLKDRYPRLRDVPGEVIPHGDYRGAYPAAPERDAARASLGLPGDATVFLTLGQVRRYKNLPSLVRGFRGSRTEQRGGRLVIAGEPRDAGLGEELDEAVGGDESVCLLLHLLTDDEVSTLHAACDIVVLPYRQSRSVLHSGAAILALSFNRPVVVTDTPTMRELQERVGSRWLGLSNGTPEDALAVAASMFAEPREREAPLADLAWPLIARQTLAAYERAVAHRVPAA